MTVLSCFISTFALTVRKIDLDEDMEPWVHILNGETNIKTPEPPETPEPPSAPNPDDSSFAECLKHIVTEACKRDAANRDKHEETF